MRNLAHLVPQIRHYLSVYLLPNIARLRPLHAVHGRTIRHHVRRTLHLLQPNSALRYATSSRRAIYRVKAADVSAVFVLSCNGLAICADCARVDNKGKERQTVEDSKAEVRSRSARGKSHEPVGPVVQRTVLAGNQAAFVPRPLRSSTAFAGVLVLPTRMHDRARASQERMIGCVEFLSRIAKVVAVESVSRSKKCDMLRYRVRSAKSRGYRQRVR